jgi:oxygen-independent coproporphyrinogen-3 oxidase
VAAGLVPAPDPDLQADQYELACDRLRSAGYEHYEVSNWARPGHRCRHNMGYWEGRPYLGLGAGAHSYRDGRRWWNVRPPQQYLSEVEAGRAPVGDQEVLSDDERSVERLLLGLRLADGVPAAWLAGDRVAEFVAEGLAVRTNGTVRLTEAGFLLANEITLGLSSPTPAPSRPQERS